METICVKCKNHYMGVHLDEGMHMCEAYGTPKKTNYVTGDVTPAQDSYCHEVNKHGQCPQYKKK